MSSSAVLWRKVVFVEMQLTDFIRLSQQPPRTLLTRPRTVCLTWKIHLFCLGGKHLKMFPWTTEKEKIMSQQQQQQKKASTGTNDKGTDNCFPAQVSFWWMSHYNLEMTDVCWIKTWCVCVCVICDCLGKNEGYEGLSILFFAQWGVTVRSERF